MSHEKYYDALPRINFMKRLSSTDRVAAIQNRLKETAKATGIGNPNILHIRYSLERFLYRLSLTKHKHRITLKGGMLFILWCEETFRPTKDADFLMSGTSDHETIKQTINDICAISVADDDAMIYHADTIKVEAIKEDDEYQGLRVSLKSTLGKIVIPVQLDIGTGDIITPKAVEVNFTVIIDELPAPRLKVYNKETVIAEKLHAMVVHDLANSRMKDFYDIWLLCTQFDYESNTLAKAISATFKRRDTEFPAEGISSLTDYFYNDKTKQTQWNAFLKKTKVKPNDLSLEQVCHEISRSLAHVFDQLQK